MTEQTEQVKGVVSAEVDPATCKFVPTGILGAETSGASMIEAKVRWILHSTTGKERFIEDQPKTLTERLNEAYSDELEPEERELLDHAAEQFGRRLASEE